LGDLAGKLLRRLAELHAAELEELQLQLVEFEGLQLQRRIGEITLGAAYPHQLP